MAHADVSFLRGHVQLRQRDFIITTSRCRFCWDSLKQHFFRSVSTLRHDPINPLLVKKRGTSLPSLHPSFCFLYIQCRAIKSALPTDQIKNIKSMSIPSKTPSIRIRKHSDVVWNHRKQVLFQDYRGTLTPQKYSKPEKKNDAFSKSYTLCL